MQWHDLVQFQVTCERAGVKPPTPITRGMELIELARAEEKRSLGSLLDLADDEVAERVEALSIRGHGGAHRTLARPLNGLEAGLEEFETQLVGEVREATLPHLDEIIVSQREAFDAAVKPFVVAAQQFGFTFQTNSDDVVRMRDQKATEAWADLPAAFPVVGPIARLRETISRLFEVSPTLAERNRALNIYRFDPEAPLDFSVCFAANGNWGLEGNFYVTGKRPGQELGQIDWLALAKDGLHLNTPDEVRLKFVERERLLSSSTPQPPAVSADPVDQYPTF